MGPNVKFVSAITDAFSNKKNGGQFFSAKKTKPGGGVQGRFGKRPYFCRIFFTPSLKIYENLKLNSILREVKMARLETVGSKRGWLLSLETSAKNLAKVTAGR